VRKLYEIYRNNVLCRREPNQRKALSAWNAIKHLIPVDERFNLEIDHGHYKLGQLTADEFGKAIKEVEIYFNDVTNFGSMDQIY